MGSSRLVPCPSGLQSIHTGARVGGAPLGLRRIGTATIVLWSVITARPREIQGQVGLTSGETRVALVAVAPAHASLVSVSPPQQAAGAGSVRQKSVTVRLTGNNGYRLLVRRSGNNTSGAAGRIWVRGADGDFHELTPGSAVTIADEPLAGDHQQEVLYRLEDLTRDDGKAHSEAKTYYSKYN